MELEDYYLDPMTVQMLTCPRLGEIYLHAAGAVRAYDARTLEVIAQTPDFDGVTQVTRSKERFSGHAVIDDARSRLFVLDGNTIGVIDLQESNFGTAASVQGERRIMLELPS